MADEERGGAAEAAAGEERREELGESNGSTSGLGDSATEVTAGEGVGVNSAAESNGGDPFQELRVEIHREVAAIGVHHGGKVETESLICSSPCLTSLSKPTPTSVAVSTLSPAMQEQRPLPRQTNTELFSAADHSSSSPLKTVSLYPIVRTPASDGYNWRKYGQKQVKSPKGSRSYYKCTYSDCRAKKIECSSDSGHVIEVVNKGLHSHDPPPKNNSARESRVVSVRPPTSKDTSVENPVRMLDDSDPSTSTKEPIHEKPVIPERKRQNSSGSTGNGEMEVKEHHITEPEPKRRAKKDNSMSSDSISKPGKKHKFVVHAAGDVGISGDGYRWRKYGQKMVKGNPNPRNYYRCTSAGCPARKHIETAVDNSTAVIITYKGVHDHGMPVPKRRHGPPSAPLVAAVAPASMSNPQTRIRDKIQSQVTANQCSVGAGAGAGAGGEMGGEALDIGGEKTIESARTLVSIGFEIKQC